MPAEVPDPDSRRIRIEWEGAEYRGRFRQVVWGGSATLTGNAITGCAPVNFFDPDKTLTLDSPRVARWQALTTGNTGAADLWLAEARAGEIHIDTPLVRETVRLADVTSDGPVFDRSAALARWLRVVRRPERMDVTHLCLSRPVTLSGARDNPIWLRLVQEDGTRAWTSPIYIYR